jgi:hypothetical protein
VISERSRGAFRPIYEIAFNHFNRRKGFPMHYTLEVLKKSVPKASSATSRLSGLYCLTIEK